MYAWSGLLSGLLSFNLDAFDLICCLNLMWHVSKILDRVLWVFWNLREFFNLQEPRVVFRNFAIVRSIWEDVSTIFWFRRTWKLFFNLLWTRSRPKDINIILLFGSSEECERHSLIWVYGKIIAEIEKSLRKWR